MIVVKRSEIVLSGFGGQGIVLGGIILAEAAAIYADKYATHNQSYGPEARGGASKSEVIIANEPIHYPEIDTPDILVALTKLAAQKNVASVKKQGKVIIDSSITDLETREDITLYRAPIIETAAKSIGNPLTTNIVTLGVLAGITGVVELEDLQSAVVERVPANSREINLKALQAGFEMGSQCL